MKRLSVNDEEELLTRLSSLIDRLIISGEREFRGTDLELLRNIERYMCDQLVIAKRKWELKSILDNEAYKE